MDTWASRGCMAEQMSKLMHLFATAASAHSSCLRTALVCAQLLFGGEIWICSQKSHQPPPSRPQWFRPFAPIEKQPSCPFRFEFPNWRISEYFFFDNGTASRPVHQVNLRNTQKHPSRFPVNLKVSHIRCQAWCKEKIAEKLLISRRI